MTRCAEEKDVPTIVHWLNGNPDNRFDPDILKYPSLRLICSYRPGEDPTAYLPSQKVLILESVRVTRSRMLESLASNPESSELDKAKALKDLVKATGLLASTEGIKEIYFLDGGGGVAELATKHGFEEVNMKVYRMKL